MTPWTRWYLAPVLLLVLLPACLNKSPTPGQGNQQPTAGGGQPAEANSPLARDAADLVGDMQAQMKQQDIRYDTAAGTVSFPVEMGAPRHPVEWLLIHRKGKVHECLLITEAKAALIKAALMFTGYIENGKNMRWEEKDPMPSEDEIMAGADWVDVFPPEGKQMWLTFDWTDVEGKSQSMPVEDMIVDITTGKELVDNSWVYLGGRMHPLYRGEPEVFVADYTGNYVSVPYMTPENHLVTMVHERARDEANWWLSKRCPPVGTKGRLTLHNQETAAHKARAKRIAAEGAQAEEVDDVPPPPDGGPANSLGVPRTPDDARTRK